MSKTLSAIGRKTLGLMLIFNSIVVLGILLNILFSFYASGFAWRPYSPYLIDASLFWFTIATAFLNIAPAKLIGRANIRRVFFHHYVYGFMSIFAPIILIALFAPAYIFILLTPSQGFHMTGLQSVMIYASMCFIYGGLTLVVDDIYDVSLNLARIFEKIRTKISNMSRTFRIIHLFSSLSSIYVSICAIVWYIQNSFWLTRWPFENLAHLLFISNLLITSLLGLKIVSANMWLRTLKKPYAFLWLEEKIKV